MKQNVIEIRKYKNIDYVIRQPQNSSEGKYPLVIYLHGAGGRGRNTEVIFDHPFFAETEAWLNNAISLAPQCYEDSWFTIFEQLQDFIEYAVSWACVDSTRVYLVGASMGGYATWQMAMSRPELFAAILPICGGGMYWNGARLKNMGVWAFHGEQDCTVLPEESRKMVDAVNNCGGKAKLTIYKDCAHNAWEPTFLNREVWDWLLTNTLCHHEEKSSFDNVKQYG